LPYTISGFIKQQQKWAYGNFKAFVQHAKDLLFSKNLSALQKFLVSFTTLGYTSSIFIAFFTVASFLHMFTLPPKPLMLESFATFLRETSQTLVLLSGFLFAAAIALKQEKRTKDAFLLILTALTIGVVTAFKIGIAIIKAALRLPMTWYMVPKTGNQNFLKQSKVRSNEA
jgi:lysylphosphatidylglycerol synthetase-like protein (DUF2156 family)